MSEFTQRERYYFLVRVALSVILCSASLFVILDTNYPDATIKWAFGIIGLIIGYWLK